MANNIQDINLTDLDKINSTLGVVDGVAYTVNGVSSSYENIYSKISNLPDTMNTATAKQRTTQQRRATDEAIINSMKIQSEMISRVGKDQSGVNALVSKSQAAQGNLDVSQAGNQLLAQNVKQNIKTQQLLAAHYRLEASKIAEEQSTKYQQEARHNYLAASMGKNPSKITPTNDFPFVK